MAEPKVFYVYAVPGTPVMTDELCQKCWLPIVRVPIYLLGEDGPRQMATVETCGDDCDG